MTPPLNHTTHQTEIGPIHHIWTLKSPQPPIILAHGAFSNHKSMMILAKKLAQQSYECWLFDWPIHTQANTRFIHDFDTYTAHFEKVLTVILELAQKQYIHWLGHSGGGLIPLMAIARKPDIKQHLSSIITLASQASGIAAPFYRRHLIDLCQQLLKLRKGKPLLLPAIGPVAESSLLLEQWCQWNSSHRWQGHDGFDYQHHLNHLNLPMLAFAAGNDPFIAPPSCCKALFDSYASKQKQFIHCHIDNGFSKNYRHGELVTHPDAILEISQHLQQWLQQLPNNASNPVQLKAV